MWYNKFNNVILYGRQLMDIRVGDLLTMKKTHPGGSKQMTV